MRDQGRDQEDQREIGLPGTGDQTRLRLRSHRFTIPHDRSGGGLLLDDEHASSPLSRRSGGRKGDPEDHEGHRGWKYKGRHDRSILPLLCKTGDPEREDQAPSSITEVRAER